MRKVGLIVLDGWGLRDGREGNAVALTKGRYGLLQESQDRAVRRASYDALMRAQAAKLEERA